MGSVALLIGGILLAAALVLFVLAPVLRGEEAPMERQDHEPTEAEVRSALALRALRDAEYDLASGKLDEDDYRELRAEISREALDALRARDAQGDGSSGEPGEGERPRGEASARSDVGLEEEIRAFREALREGRGCRSCGRRNRPGSRFCGGCGERLKRPEGEEGGGEDRSGASGSRNVGG